MLHENLTILRTAHGFSQEEVAEKIGISRQAYAKWERGETIPDVEKCALLAELYHTTIDSLLHFDSKQEGMNILPAPKGKHIWGSVTINERGQIVIPKAAREHFQMENGQRLVVLGEDGEGIALVKSELFEQRMKQAFEMANRNTGEK